MMEFELKTADQDATKDVNIDIGTIQLHFTAEEEKRVVRKIDCFILPLVGNPFLKSRLHANTDFTDVLGVLLSMCVAG